jgi:PKD repeat protein
VPAIGTQTIDLSPFLNSVETKPAGQVLNTGIRIVATAMVSVQYEVQSTQCNCNPEVIVLKGRTSLSRNFIIPSQITYNNNTSLNPVATHSFDIVAAEDNTVVTITASNPIVGNGPGVPFNVTLNRGQTYSAEAQFAVGVGHLAGSIVQSTKPVAITIKDDQLMATSGFCTDLAADQIVGVNAIDKQYIIRKGLLNNNDDRIVIVATENNTNVFIDGSVVPNAVLNSGQIYTASGFLNNDIFIEAGKPIYVLHLTGVGCEMTHALVPPLNCNGSQNAIIKRHSNDSIYAMIVVPAGGEDDFFFNGTPNIIQASMFTPVAITGNQYYSAFINISNLIALGQRAEIANANTRFQLAILNGNSTSGARYGFYSAFNIRDIGYDPLVCKNDILKLDAGEAMDSYSWNTGSNQRFIFPLDSGTYWVQTVKAGCVSVDTIQISYLPYPFFTFGNDTVICTGTSLQLTAPLNFPGYLWHDNSTDPFNEAFVSNLYWAEVTNNEGCKHRDSIQVDVLPFQQITLTAENEQVCISGSTTLTGSGASDFNWSPNVGLSATTGVSVIASPPVTTKYYIKNRTQNGCTNTDSVTILVLPPLAVNKTADTTICKGGSANLGVTVSGGNGGPYFFNWSNNAYLDRNTESSATAFPPQTTTFMVRVWDTCSTPDANIPITVFVQPLPDVQFSVDTNFSCNPIMVNFTSPASNFNCKWYFGDGDSSSICNPSHFFAAQGTYNVIHTAEDSLGCRNISNPQPIVIYPQPNGIIDVNSSIISINKPEAYFSSDRSTGQILERLWSFGDLNYSTETNPTHIYRKAGEFEVRFNFKSSKFFPAISCSSLLPSTVNISASL